MSVPDAPLTVSDWTGADSTLAQWKKRARESQFSHSESAKYFESRNYWLGVPAVILSSLVGTTVFATLQKQVSLTLQLAVGAISVTAAILASLQTFLRFSERAEKHRNVAAQYGAIRRSIEEVASLPPTLRGAPKELLEQTRKRLDALAEAAPTVPTWIWNRTTRELQRDDHKAGKDLT